MIYVLIKVKEIFNNEYISYKIFEIFEYLTSNKKKKKKKDQKSLLITNRTCQFLVYIMT